MQKSALCFSIKYLGVPLITTRLRAEDCVLLRDKVVQRIVNCAGHWSSIFILPEKVITKLKALPRVFLYTLVLRSIGNLLCS